MGRPPAILLKKFELEPDAYGYAKSRARLGNGGGNGGMHPIVPVRACLMGVTLGVLVPSVLTALAMAMANVFSIGFRAGVGAIQTATGTYQSPVSTLAVPAPDVVDYNVP